MMLKGFRKSLSCLMLVSVFCSGLYTASSLAQGVPSAKLPAVITTCGQSPDGYMVKILCDRIKVKVSYDPMIAAKDLKEFRTLFVVMGGSSKGLGEAGIDEGGELERVKGLLAKAKEQKAMVIGTHVGGEPRRGPLSQKFISLVAPSSDYLIVIEDGNKDGYFTKLSKEKKIPLALLKDTADIGDLLKKIFQVK